MRRSRRMASFPLVIAATAIGARRFYSVEQLAAAMPQVGDHLSDRSLSAGPCGPQGADECVKHPLSSSGPEYSFQIVIRRVKDGSPVNAPIR